MSARETFWRIVGALASTVFALFLIVKVLGIENGLVGIIITFLIFLLFFQHKMAAAGPKLRTAFIITGVVMLLMNWNFSSPTTWWFINQTERLAPRNNFDPRSEVTPGDLTAGAQVKFERQPDGSLIPVPVSWIRHRVTGFPLNNPGTPEYWEELNQYNAEVGRRGGSIERETPEELELKWVPGFPKPFPLKSGGPTETPVVSLPSPPEGADYGYRTWWDLQGEGCVRVWYNGRDLGTDCVGVVEPTFKKAMLSQFGYPRSYQFELVGDGDLTVTVGRLRKPW